MVLEYPCGLTAPFKIAVDDSIELAAWVTTFAFAGSTVAVALALVPL